ncbi:MAG: PIG-L family deacetylase [Streptosporangiales bacterium]|nr:PIG-L family deacetylase [Streptosporangiales bacterium]
MTTARGVFDDVHRVLAVVAHPDDESFGLGAVIDRLVTGSAEVFVLCFTHGEASTLRGREGDLAAVRAAELADAARILGVTRTHLLDYRDTGLADVPVPTLAARVREVADQDHPSHLLAFDAGGVTGHRDHRQATGAALTAADVLGVPVIGWTVPEAVAGRLNSELGTSFVGRSEADIDWTITVDRVHQWKAIAAHASQSADNPVLHRRLALLGDTEHLRRLRP